MRDERITMIYEGTHEIQAIDLLVRKVLADNGGRLQYFLKQVDATADGKSATELALHGQLAARIDDVTQAITGAGAGQAPLPYRIAPEMLRLVGHCALAWL